MLYGAGTRGVPAIPKSGGGGGDTGLATVSNAFSMAFNGVDDYFSIGSIDVTGTASVSFWFNAGVSGNNGGIFTMASSATNCISISLWQSNIQVYAGSSITRARSTDTISTSTWYHIVVVKSASAINNIYINGVNKTLDALGAWTGAINTPQAKIGEATFSGTDYNFTGKIDEVAFFTASLDASTVESIYSASLPLGSGVTGDLTKLDTPPVAWYRMGD